MSDQKRTHIDYGYGLSDFQQFGINFLTGEACGYGGRILADLDEKAADMVEDFLGGNLRFVRGTQWNGGVASVMIPRGMIGDLAVYCLLCQGWAVVVHRDGYVVRGWTRDGWDEVRDRYLTVYPGSRVYINSGTAGLRNRHEFTGRIE